MGAINFFFSAILFPSGAMYRAEEAVQASRESLKDAVELGLKSKVTGENFTHSLA